MGEAARGDAEVLLLAGVDAARRGALAEAARLWGQLLGMAPPADVLTQAWFNLGLLCMQSADAAAATDCYRNALAADDRNFEALENLSLLLAEAGETDAARAGFERLASEAPQPRRWFNLGILQSRAGRLAQAEDSYRQGLAMQPDHADTLSNLGLLLAERGLPDDALVCLRRAAAAAPDNPLIVANLGALLESGDQLDMAAACLQRAVELAPASAVAHCNLGVARVEQGELAAAEESFRAAMALDPAYLAAPAYLAQLLLATGRYGEGWPLHEVRFALAAAGGKPMHVPVPWPQWQGEPLDGKRILIVPEQGYGDEIQFARYIPLLRGLGATHISVLCRAALLPVLRTLQGVDAVLDMESAAALPAHDCWATSMSLPGRLGLGGDIPAQLPYLSADPQRMAHWQERLDKGEGRLRVGLLWQGNPLHENDAHRSLPGVGMLAPLWQVSGVDFISLQREPVPGPCLQALREFKGEIADFGDAAAIIAQLDLIISVDSAYAHLAGALGKPVWLLLPARKTDWRWGRVDETSAWYPGVMRIFRQDRRGDWNTVLTRLVEALSGTPAGAGFSASADA